MASSRAARRGVGRVLEAPEDFGVGWPHPAADCHNRMPGLDHASDIAIG
jgi:hypothetical protein